MGNTCLAPRSFGLRSRGAQGRGVRVRSYSKVAPALTSVLLGFVLAGCEQAPEVLRIVSGPPAGNQEIAVLLANASDEVATPIRLAPGTSVAGAEEALEALAAGTAELAIVENNASYRHPGVRTIAPLYPSVLHIAVRPERRRQGFREVFDGATVFAGAERAPARALLNRMATMYAWSGIEFSYVDTMESDPDIIVAFAPISPRAAPVLDGYELLSLGSAEDVGAGSLADGLSLVAPFLRPFVIPEGTYGLLTREPIVTVAVDALLVTRADTSRVVAYDLLESIQTMGPLLVSQRPDLEIDDLDAFKLAHLTFPLHVGAQSFRARNQPGFVERAAGVLEIAITVSVGVGTALLALLRYWGARKKSRIDTLYSRVLAIRERVSPGLSEPDRQILVGELRGLRDHAFSLLIQEQLAADDSFRILQTLIADVIAELEKRA